MNIEQHAALQGRVVETQRLALHLAEEGHSDASRALLQAITRMQRIKPTKSASQDNSESPGGAEQSGRSEAVSAESVSRIRNAAKGKGA